MNFENLSLIGFMGAGKSTIGKILAEKLGLLFIDIDKVIELKEKRSIPEIFKTSGENYFRDIESEVIKKLYDNKNCVFACGGGAIIRGENFNVIRAKSKIIYLKVSPREIIKRIGESKNRPLLNSKDKESRIINLLNKRKNIYENRADIIIDTGMKTKTEVINEIMERLK